MELGQQHPWPQLPQFNYVWNNTIADHTSAIWTGQEDVKTGLSKATSEGIQYLKDQGVL